MRAFWIGLSCVAVCLIPLICGAVWRKRVGAMRPVGFGILGFFAFSAIVETVFVLFFLSAAGAVTRALNASPLRLVVFSCLCAGFFEEWGRYWIYSNGLQHCEGRGVPIGYAIGHFGAELLSVHLDPDLASERFAGHPKNMIGRPVFQTDVLYVVVVSFCNTAADE